MDQAVVDKYVDDFASHPDGCPYCGNLDLQYKSFDTEGISVYQDVYCGGCNESWTNVYHLVGVIDRADGLRYSTGNADRGGE